MAATSTTNLSSARKQIPSSSSGYYSDGIDPATNDAVLRARALKQIINDGDNAPSMAFNGAVSPVNPAGAQWVDDNEGDAFAQPSQSPDAYQNRPEVKKAQGLNAQTQGGPATVNQAPSNFNNGALQNTINPSVSNAEPVQKARSLKADSAPGTTGNIGNALKNRLSPDAANNLQNTKQKLEQDRPKASGQGRSSLSGLGDKLSGAGSQLTGAGGQALAGAGMKETTGIDPQQITELGKRLKSGDVSGAVKGAMDLGSQEGIEMFYDWSLRGVMYFGVGIIGMEIAVIAAWKLGVKITPWKRYLVWGINALIGIALLLIMVFIGAVVMSLIKMYELIPFASWLL